MAAMNDTCYYTMHNSTKNQNKVTVVYFLNSNVKKKQW